MHNFIDNHLQPHPHPNPPLEGEGTAQRDFFNQLHKIFCSPFKGEAGRGMGFLLIRPHPHPNPPLEGEGFVFSPPLEGEGNSKSRG